MRNIKRNYSKSRLANQKGGVLPLMVVTMIVTVLMIGLGTSVGIWFIVQQEERNVAEMVAMTVLHAKATSNGDPYGLMSESGQTCYYNCGPGLGYDQATALAIGERAGMVYGIGNTDQTYYLQAGDLTSSAHATVEWGTCDPETLIFSPGGGLGKDGGLGVGGGGFGSAGLAGMVAPQPSFTVTGTGLRLSLRLRNSSSIMKLFSGLFGSSSNPLVKSKGVGCYFEYDQAIAVQYPFSGFFHSGRST